MQKPKLVSELIASNSKALRALRSRVDARAATLIQVRALLPGALGSRIVTADVKDRTLILGASSAAWASRLRFLANELLSQWAQEQPIRVDKIRVKIVMSKPAAK